jgi:hypothetical protein
MRISGAMPPFGIAPALRKQRWLGRRAVVRRLAVWFRWNLLAFASPSDWLSGMAVRGAAVSEGRWSELVDPSLRIALSDVARDLHLGILVVAAHPSRVTDG